MRVISIGFLLMAMLAACAEKSEAPPPDEKARAAETGDAFFAVEADEEEGRLLVTLPAPDEDGVMLRAIHASGITAGLGSNPVGFDRGAVESGRVIAIRKVGKKAVIEQENWTYRATADNPLEKKAVENSFARSFLWAGEIVEDRGAGGVVIDLSGFLVADTMDLKGALKNAGQGAYSIAAERSFPDYSSVLVFPDNVELDAFVTFTGETPGGEVSATAADGRSFTLTLHHSFVRLPEPGFKPRAFDPRMNGIDVSYYDFSAPLDAPIANAFARRFRLERVDPNAEKGPVKKPIVFYVDPGAPLPVREALIEGASWWAEAFEAAGFEDAFRVELLPEDAHPMDVRYNVIQWVHRQTRGWSYGGGVADPRTGEMIKAAVILGSQRVRQDRMIFEGLAGAEKSGTGAEDDPVEIALARIRQLSAHEVGHPLGFAHNFAASVNDRASVMDYPAPYIRPRADGTLDFSAAYDSGIGEWDKVATRWLYAEFPEGTDEKAALEEIVDEAYASGLHFMDDPQGRPVSGAHPLASVWDNGADPVATLRETMRVREIALSNFGDRALKADRPLSELRSVIVPVYLYHRYQVAAAAKLVGGYDFRYAAKGDGVSGGAPVPAERQRAALAVLVETLNPAALDLPDATLNRLTPPLASFYGNAKPEVFESDTGAMFDLVSAADAAASETLSALLHPERLARLIETQRRDDAALGPEEVFAAIEERAFAPVTAPRRGELSRAVQTRFVSTLIDHAASEATPPPVAARIDAYLAQLRGRLAPGLFSAARAAADQGHRGWLAARIDAHLKRPAPSAAATVEKPKTPPGSPIGAGEECWFCDMK